MTLKECREHLTITLNGKTHLVKLSGTVDEPFFCGKDICEILEYKDPKDALQRHVDDDDKKSLIDLWSELGGAAPPNHQSVVYLGKHSQKPSYHEGKAVYISEPGLYALVLASQAPVAKDFRKMVCTIILPTIRKFGSFHLENQLEDFKTQLALKDQYEKELQDRLENERQYTMRLKEMLVSDEKLEPSQVIYIATSKNYAAQNRFKVGGVESLDKLKGRLSTYNSRSAQGDDFFFSDTFMVLDYKQIESRLKLLVGRFRDKASKEIYIMHHTNLRYIVQFLCDRFNDDVAEVNEKLAEFIDNLNVHNLRPVIPLPKEIKMVSTTLVCLGASGGVDVKTKFTDDEDFCAAVESLIMSLPEGTTEVVKKEILDQLHVKTERRRKEAVILEVMSRLRPDLRLIRRNTTK